MRQTSERRQEDRQVQRLRALVHELAQSFAGSTTRQKPRGARLSPSYEQCLRVMVERERAGLDTSQSELAARVGIDKSGIARLCGTLETAGHATQEPSAEDGRSRIVCLTPSGARLARRLEAASREHFRRLLLAIAPADRTGLIDSLTALLRAVQTQAQCAGADDRGEPWL